MIARGRFFYQEGRKAGKEILGEEFIFIRKAEWQEKMGGGYPVIRRIFSKAIFLPSCLPDKILFSVLVIFCLLWLPGRAANERDLWTLWTLAEKTPDDHDRVIAACRAFAAANAQDELLPVARGIEAWRLLKTGRTNDAVAVMTPYLADSEKPVAAGAQILSRAWLTRLDRPLVEAALKEYYRAEIRYPDNLAQLTAHPRIAAKPPLPPVVDRWNAAWRYSAAGYEGVPGFIGQKYLLQSYRLGDTSDLSAALAIPYASRVQFTLLPAGEAATGPAVARVETTAADGRKTVTVTEAGRLLDPLYIAHVGPNLVVACDRLHWRVVQTPKPRP